MKKQFAFLFLQLIIVALLSTISKYAVSASSVIANEIPNILIERSHSKQVTFIQTINGGQNILSIDYSGSIFLWDAQSLRQVSATRKISIPVINATQVGPRTLLVAGTSPNDYLALIDIYIPGELILGKMNGELKGFSKPDSHGNTRAIIINESTIRVVEVSQLGVIKEVQNFSPQGIVSSVAISDDGRYLAIATMHQQSDSANDQIWHMGDMLLIEVDSKVTKWKRKVDSFLTRVAFDPKNHFILGSYGNVAGDKLKRIDQFSFESGKTENSISTEPCSVFQTSVIAADRGFAICSSSTLDMLSNLGKNIKPRTLFMSWTLSSSSNDLTSISPSDAPLTYLPFSTAVIYDEISKRIFVGDGSGSIYSLHLSPNLKLTDIHNLPSTSPNEHSSKFSASLKQRKLYTIAEPVGRNGNTYAIKTKSRDVLLALSKALDQEKFSNEELQELVNEFPEEQIQNKLISWNIENASLDSFSTKALSGNILDVVAIDNGGVYFVERWDHLNGNNIVEPTIISVSQFAGDDSLVTLNRRVFSIDSNTGLLKEGIRKRKEDSNYRLSYCGSATPSRGIRLSSDGSVLIALCLMPYGTAEENITNPSYDLLTFPLATPSGIQPARIRFSGTPELVELSRDGSLVAIVTSSWAGKSVLEEKKQSLLLIDTKTANIVGNIIKLGSLPNQNVNTLLFSKDMSRLFFAMSDKVYCYEIGTNRLSPFDLESGNFGNISAMTINEAGTLLAVTGYSGITQVFQLTDKAQIGQVQHSGEIIKNLVFYGEHDEHLIVSLDNGRITLINYKANRRIVDFASFENEEWIAVSQDGVFNASIEGELGLTLSVGNQAKAIDQLYDSLFRPNILRQRIAGENLPSPLLGNIEKAIRSTPPIVKAQISHIKAGELIISVQIIDTGTGIGGLRVFHNGKIIRNYNIKDIEQAGKRDRSNPKALYLDIALPVSPGANTYYIAAANNSIPSVQSRFTKLAYNNPDNQVAPPKAYVLMIGTNVNNAGLDTLAVAEKSTSLIGDRFQKVLEKIVGKDNSHVIDLLGVKSRYQAVQQTLTALERTVKANDIIVLIITTHGRINKSGEMVAILRDTTPDDKHALPITNIINSMTKIQAMTQILIMDTCQSGTLTKQIENIYQDRFAVLAGRASINIFASTSDTQLASAAYDKEEGSTMFSHFFLKELPLTSYQATPQLSLHKIAKKVKQEIEDEVEKLEGLGLKQTPMFYNFGRDLRF